MPILTFLKSILGVSSPPGCPTIELSSRMTKNPDDDTGVTDEVNIIWSVPEDDGGYPITGIFDNVMTFMKFLNFMNYFDIVQWNKNNF